jgi:hypothetical protein
VAVALPGQTFTGGVVSGMPAEQAMGVPFNITIYALVAGNAIDTSFNGTLSSLMSSGSMYNQITNPVTFVNGVAMAAVQYNWPNTSAVITASIGGVNGMASSLFVAPDQVPKELRLFSSSATLPNGYCQPILVTAQNQTQNMSGYLVSSSTRLASSMTVDLSQGSGANISFYSDDTCTSSVSSVTIPAGDSSKMFYVSFATGSNAEIQAVAAGMTTASLPITLSGSAPGTASNVQIMGHDNLQGGACQAYGLALVDSAGVSSTRPANGTLATLSSGLMDFFDDPYCQHQVSNMVIPNNARAVQFYGRAKQTGSGSLSTYISEFSASSGLGVLRIW